METISIKHKDGCVGWILVLGCPLPEKHSLADDVQDVSGPTFADCAHCDHQVGRNYEILCADGNYDGADIYPERLKCGFLQTY